MRHTTMLVVCTLALAICAGSAFAATTTPPADTLKVNYFSNANTAGAPDGTVRITHPGTATGNVCASIFVFDPQQELTECCSCLLTPDGLRTLSVNTNLTGNPLTGVILSTGVIKIVSTIPVSGACPLPTKVNSEPALRAWGTHIQNGGAVTETAFEDATLSVGENNRLAAQCFAIQLDGSGKGVCSCGTGD
ncbi:MAG TPA: hypothetical protein VI386_27490 [Candidatus Sulfotelmatobacter sp.]